jgi:hydrogenase-1 operon protein HyaF
MKPESIAPCLTDFRTGMATAVFSEIADRLAVLAETGETSAIDLKSLPMTTADRQELEDHLGQGEVSARLDVAGTSEIWETRYHGVWWIRHMGADGQVATEEIAVTPLPVILRTHPVDVEDAAKRIRAEVDFSEHTERRADNPQEASHG